MSSHNLPLMRPPLNPLFHLPWLVCAQSFTKDFSLSLLLNFRIFLDSENQLFYFPHTQGHSLFLLHTSWLNFFFLWKDSCILNPHEQYSLRLILSDYSSVFPIVEAHYVFIKWMNECKFPISYIQQLPDEYSLVAGTVLSAGGDEKLEVCL